MRLIILGAMIAALVSSVFADQVIIGEQEDDRQDPFTNLSG